MSKRISKKVREEAALLCAMMASTRQSTGAPIQDFEGPCRAIGVDCFADNGAADLARDAYWAIPKYSGVLRSREEMRALIEHVREHGPEYWAEAEAMLRTGWTP